MNPFQQKYHLKFYKIMRKPVYMNEEMNGTVKQIGCIFYEPHCEKTCLRFPTSCNKPYGTATEDG